MPLHSRLTRVAARLAGEHAYTLPELLVVLAILVTVVSALTGAFVAGLHAGTMANNRFQAQLNARLALDKMKREVHCASVATVNSLASVTVTLPTPTTTNTVACPTGTGTFTWCTRGSGMRYALYRVTAATCGTSGGAKWAAYLTTGVIFPSPTYTAPSSTSLGTLHVELPVNLTPSHPGTYDLVDDIVLRNTSRS